MSLRGVRQLRELVIRYSDYDGSSKGIREWMSKYLLSFAEKNPKLQITAEKVRCKHPYLRGNFANGNTKTICIKNADDEEIAKQILHLRNQIGRKVSALTYFTSQNVHDF
jgi:large subunit ribosomal protein L43